ncbi:MAG: beta-Ala-His dipeptidase [Mycoplasmoidaceae bacterium]|nr:MAG: beta-Ala-His dipeptidase [Mycoplasmoidaceae bacterium]
MGQNNTLKFFYEICKIPHVSKHEEKIIKYITDLFNKNNIQHKIDKTGNIYACKNPKSKKPAILLQAHLDMVGVKLESYKHDFIKDPIITYVDRGFVKAKGTTLGADNGIGVAMILSLLLDKSNDDNIEALLTVDEEIGLIGAMNILPGIFKAKYLINLDSEEDDAITIGSAGASDINIEFPVKRNSICSPNSFIIKISNGVSGHSGAQIHEQRSNTVVDTFSILKTLSHENKFNIISVNSGTARNAIPGSCQIEFACKDINKFKSEFKNLFDEYKNAYSEIDNNLSYVITPIKTKNKPLDDNSSSKLISFINASKTGLNTYSFGNDITTSSTNLGLIKTEDKTISAHWMTRSCYSFHAKRLENEIKSLAELAGGRLVHESSSCVGLAPMLNNPLAKIVQEVAKKEFKHDMKISSVHAGLEFGYIVSKYPKMIPVSIGPNIHNPHTPQEDVEIKSVNFMYDLLCKVIKKTK